MPLLLLELPNHNLNTTATPPLPTSICVAFLEANEGEGNQNTVK